MVTFILGQTLVFWSGILAGISFILLMFTCSFNLGCMNGICSDEKRRKLFGLHKYFVWLSIVAITVHITLGILSSIFHIWL